MRRVQWQVNYPAPTLFSTYTTPGEQRQRVRRYQKRRRPPLFILTSQHLNDLRDHLQLSLVRSGEDDRLEVGG